MKGLQGDRGSMELWIRRVERGVTRRLPSAGHRDWLSDAPGTCSSTSDVMGSRPRARREAGIGEVRRTRCDQTGTRTVGGGSDSPFIFFYTYS